MVSPVELARHACVRPLGALTDAARIFNSIGKPVTTMIGDEQLLMISCGDCGEAITSEMRTEAEIIEAATASNDQNLWMVLGEVT